MRLEAGSYWYPFKEKLTVKDSLLDLVCSYRDWILRRGYFVTKSKIILDKDF